MDGNSTCQHHHAILEITKTHELNIGDYLIHIDFHQLGCGLLIRSRVANGPPHRVHHEHPSCKSVGWITHNIDRGCETSTVWVQTLNSQTTITHNNGLHSHNLYVCILWWHVHPICSFSCIFAFTHVHDQIHVYTCSMPQTMQHIPGSVGGSHENKWTCLAQLTSCGQHGGA